MEDRYEKKKLHHFCSFLIKCSLAYMHDPCAHAQQVER